jgi:hypothetical protein
MNRLVTVLVIICLGCIASLAMLTALASASASLANGVANAAASTALMTSQCTSTLMILVALASGGVLGAGIARIQIDSRLSASKPWLPGPNAHWQQLDHIVRPQLPAPQPQIAERPPTLLVAKTDDDVDLPLQGWGF